MNRNVVGSLHGCLLALSSLLTLSATAHATPKVIVISLDGATPRLVNQYLADGSLPANQGIGLLKSKGLSAARNQTVNPSLTAPGHIAIATGSSAAKNDVVANTFALGASPFGSLVSGFAAPIGGYEHTPLGEDLTPSAIPLWQPLRAAGRTVVAATWPGADGANIAAPGLPSPPNALVQVAAKRTVDLTVPFGAFGGQGARGYALTAANFTPSPTSTTDQLTAAGRAFFSPVLETTLETFTLGGRSFTLRAATLDTTNDGLVNYDTLVFFDATLGIPAVTPALPATGPAYVKASEEKSAPFYFEGSSNHAGCGFYVTLLAPDLSTVRIVRYSANGIPRTSPVPAVIADIDDIEATVGFWAPQPDFRIPERLSPGFGSFPDLELEKSYEDSVALFVDYQKRVVLRAIQRNPNADLIMAYIEQPDGSSHQYLLTDPRQATDPTNPNSIMAGQDAAKVARYAGYVRFAYQNANAAVQSIIAAVGTLPDGRPASDVFVVSDHGFETFHTAVNMQNVLAAAGVPDLVNSTRVRAVTSGPAVNLYINLAGRQPGGTVNATDYATIQAQIVAALNAAVDSNPNYAPGGAAVFDKIYTRPLTAPVGFATTPIIGQDSGDVVALLRAGYNFDGIQAPVVQRLGDPVVAAPVLSVPNFYGAHGYDPELPNMSAVLYAAGPNFRPRFMQVRNIDVAPTVLSILGVAPPATVEGVSLLGIPVPAHLTPWLLAMFSGITLLGYGLYARRRTATQG